MEFNIFSVLMILAGTFFFSRNVYLWRNEDKLRTYLTTSPKAKHWVGRLGIEKTVTLSKNLFLPLGCAVAAGMLGYGVWTLFAAGA